MTLPEPRQSSDAQDRRDRGAAELAFEALYAAHYQAIAAYVLRRVPAQDADDVTAQVFAVAWRRFADVPAPPQDRLWLYGVARNTVSGQQRAARRWLHLRNRLSYDTVIGSGVLAYIPAVDPVSEEVRAAMSALRPADREALQLVLWDELSHAEAAAVLGCSPNAFELRYRRARNAVRDTVTAKRPANSAGANHAGEGPVRLPQESRTEQP
jgi:RNA polymerase sigma-70 factor (ECF subfamily)